MRVERGVDESTETSSSSACLRPPTTLRSAECEIGHETLQTSPQKMDFRTTCSVLSHGRGEQHNRSDCVVS